MKLIAICLNVLLIVTGVYLFAAKGPPGKDEMFIVVVLYSQHPSLAWWPCFRRR